MALGQWPPRGGALRRYVDQGDGSGAWSSPGEGPGAGGDELQSPIVAGTLSVRAEVLGPWWCDWGLSFILRMRRPLGAQALLDLTVPLCLGDLPCPCLVAADSSGLLRALGARPGGQQGGWLVRGKMLGCFSSLSPCWRRWELL